MNFQNIPQMADTFSMVEAGSGKKFDIFVESRDSQFSILALGGGLTYRESFTVRNDTFFLDKRFFKVGLLGASLTYNPKRIRIVLPFSTDNSWSYKGTERGPGYSRNIFSRGFMKMSGDTIFVYNISERGGAEDTAVVAFDSAFNLCAISIQIPNILSLHKLLGFKSRNLILRRTSE